MRGISVVILFVAGCGGPPSSEDLSAEGRPPGFRRPQVVVRDDPAANADGGAPIEPPEGPIPVPISGGTLLALADGSFAAASPDADTVYIADVGDRTAAAFALQAGDEPGRMAEAPDGRIWIALRRGSEVAVLDRASGVVERHPSCVAPRGIAVTGDGAVTVACASGELVQHDLSGAITRRAFLEPDLRDVVVSEGVTYVSVFRTAEVLALDDAWDVTERLRPAAIVTTPTETVPESHRFVPTVAWRTIAAPAGGVLVVHQETRDDNVPLRRRGGGGYADPLPVTPGDACALSSVVQSAVSKLAPGTAPETVPVDGAALAVDLVYDAAANLFTVPDAGRTNEVNLRSGALGPAPAEAFCEPSHPLSGRIEPGRPRALALSLEGALVVQTERELLLPDGTAIALGSAPAKSIGFELFHRSVNGIACASCHPEGGDDGHVWTFNGDPRRTPSLRGGLLGSEPFHWGGEEEGMYFLTIDTLFQMGAAFGVETADAYALGRWLHALPPTAAVGGADAERGAALFAEAGCTDCHRGWLGTDNDRHLVRETGQSVQTPVLRDLAVRAPYMFDGCARTLREAFAEGCGLSPMHGHVDGLSAEELVAIEAYLRSR